MEVVEKSNQPVLDTLKVLIADDDPPTRILLRAAISQWGYTVIEAKDGEEAWNILTAENPPELLILDWLMPKVDGLTLCSRLKQKNGFHPYIILLTQVTGTTNIVKGLEAGADEFLSKPFNMAELRSRLSVGARIVRFEKILAEHAKEVLSFHLHLESISAHMKDITSVIDSILADAEILSVINKDESRLKKIDSLKKNIENMKLLLKEFNNNKKSEGG